MHTYSNVAGHATKDAIKITAGVVGSHVNGIPSSWAGMVAARVSSWCLEAFATARSYMAKPLDCL